MVRDRGYGYGEYRRLIRTYVVTDRTSLFALRRSGAMRGCGISPSSR